MSIRVVSKRKHGEAAKQGESVVYIGRPSALGNPFNMQHEGQRSEVIAAYEAWLREQWKIGGAAKRELLALANRVRGGECIALQCWCAPLACHGDVIKKAVEGIIAKQ